MTKTKITLTQEQATVIKGLRENRFENDTIIRKAVHVKTTGEGIGRWFDKLSEMDLDTLIKALYIGYEVEPVFSLGEQVVYGNKVFAICNIPYIGKVNLSGRTGVITNVSVNDIRHATQEEVTQEKERSKWAEINREVGEIKEGDIGVGNSGLKMICKHEIEKAHALNSLIGFYPTESYVCLLDGDADV